MTSAVTTSNSLFQRLLRWALSSDRSRGAVPPGGEPALAAEQHRTPQQRSQQGVGEEGQRRHIAGGKPRCGGRIEILGQPDTGVADNEKQTRPQQPRAQRAVLRFNSMLVAELGSIVEDHLKTIGLMHDPEMSEHQRALIAEKRRAYEENRSKKKPELSDAPSPSLFNRS